MTPFAEKAYEACAAKARLLGRRLNRTEWLETVQSTFDEAVSRPKREFKRNELLDALATVGGGVAAEIVPSKWSGIAKALAEIKSVTPSVTPAEIKRRAANYRTYFPDAALTPFALVSHWAACATEKRRSTTDQGPVIYR